MDRLPSMLAAAVAAVLAGAVSERAHADPYASGGQAFEYGPYNGREGRGPSTPDESNFKYLGAEPPPPSGAPAGGESAYAAPPASAGQAARSDAGRGWDPDANYSDNRGSGAMGDAYSPSRDGPAAEAPPPRGPGGPPMRGLGGALPRIEVQAAAPDDGVPYTVREHDARQAAIDGWRGKVSDQYGPEFSHWQFAVGKHVDCHPDRRDGIICTASAQPARGYDRNGAGPEYAR